MDNFMDKLAHKINAQEMIKANSTAEAMEMKRLQMQVGEYEKILQEIRIVNLKNAEAVDSIQKLADESLGKIKECRKEETNLGPLQESIEESLEKLKKSMEEALQKSDEYVHTESVKVYRNVQAVVTDGFKEHTEKVHMAEQGLTKRVSGLKPFAIITMILIATDLIVHILEIVGIF